MTANNTCLDLFAGLGGFSQAFVESEKWDVITVELEPEFDPDIQANVFELQPSDLPQADVILASPPCTKFSIVNQGNGDWEDGEPASDGCRDAIGLVYHTLGLIHGISPDYWFLENPRGLLRRVLGEPEGTVTYCQYGENYQKPTDLWGEHPRGFSYKSCSPGDSCHIANPRSEHPTQGKYPNDSNERAKVPYELSKEILDSVESQPEQTTLFD